MNSDEAYQKLMRSALNYVSMRLRSETELKNFIENKIIKYQFKYPDILNRVLTRLQDLGYADDRKFTLWWIGQRQSGKKISLRAISNELVKKGISKELIREIIDENNTERENDIDVFTIAPDKRVALAALKRKINIWNRLSNIEFKKKIFAYLANRGFDSETIYGVIDDLVKNGYNSH
jgi:regulatory protein